METLTAFVRKYSQRNYAEFKKSYERISQVAHTLWEEKGQPEGKDDEIWREAIQRGEPPETEIIAVLTVIERRVEQNEQNWKREEINDWRFDFNRAVLKKISLMGTHLERANFRDARLEQAYLAGVHLERADLGLAHLQSAILVGAHLQGAILWKTHLEGANLTGAHLKRANFFRTHLEGADLFGASDVSTEQLLTAYGDAATRLPKDVDRPPHWPSGSPRPADVGPRLKSHKFSPLEMSRRTNRI
jgi:hypothetical protein